MQGRLKDPEGNVLMTIRNHNQYIIGRDQIDDENTRNIIKIGKRVERIDLYARLRRDRAVIRREIRRLSWRICRTELIYSRAGLQRLQELADAPELDYLEIIRIVDALVEC